MSVYFNIATSFVHILLHTTWINWAKIQVRSKSVYFCIAVRALIQEQSGCAERSTEMLSAKSQGACKQN